MPKIILLWIVLLVFPIGAFAIVDGAAMVQLVQKGKVVEVEQAIKSGFPINKFLPEAKGLAPIHIAILNGQLKVLEKLLALKADPNLSLTDKTHWSPLQFVAAAAKGSGGVETAKALLRAGASLSAIDSHGDRPIHLAVQSRNRDLVNLFLNSGERVNVLENGANGLTPLGMAIFGHDLEMVKLLIGRKADVNELILSSHYLHLCASVPQPSAIDGAIAQELIKAGAKLEATDSTGASPLLVAVRKKNTPVAEALLARRVDTSTPNSAGVSPLTLAVYSRNYEMVERLMKSGADPRRTNAKGQSALSMAKDFSDPKLLSILSKK